MPCCGAMSPYARDVIVFNVGIRAKRVFNLHRPSRFRGVPGCLSLCLLAPTINTSINILQSEKRQIATNPGK